MDEQRKYAILFCRNDPSSTRKLHDSGSTPWAIDVAIADVIEKANLILKRD